MRLFKMAELADIIGWPERLLQQWQREGVIEPDAVTSAKGGKVQYSLDNLAQIIVIDRLIKSGVSLDTAGKISQDYLKGCRVLEWNPCTETAYIWINLEEPNDFVMLPDYEFDSVGFEPDSEKSYLIIPLKAVYQEVSKLINDWSGLKIKRSSNKAGSAHLLTS